MSSAEPLEPRGRPSRSLCAHRQRRLLRDIRDAGDIPIRPFPLWAKALIGLGAIALAAFVVNFGRHSLEMPEGRPALRQSISWDALPPGFKLLRSDPATGFGRGQIDVWCRLTPRAYVFHLFDPYDTFGEGRLDSLLETHPNLGLPEKAVVTHRQPKHLGIPEAKARFQRVEYIDARDGSSNWRMIGTGRKQRVIYEATTTDFDEDECARIMRAVFR
jgi:hypothetical protein